MIFLIIPVAVVGIVILIVVGAVVAGLVSRRRMLRLPPAEREAALREAQRKYDERRFGQINGHLICPHCSATGHVRTKPMTKKAGISGGKATAAVLTGGASLLATGLSRRESLTEARCGHCSSVWRF